MQTQNIKFKLSISCMTYNHSKFITDALNGFVIQKTKFPYVATIVDDASTDGEQAVIIEYINSNMDILYTENKEYGKLTFAQHKNNNNCYFAVFFLKENHYSNPTLKGKKQEYIKEWRENVDYIAFCEGDDYWIDPTKIQTQVDFLEEHQDYTLCFHNVKILDINTNELKDDFITKDVKEETTIEDLAKGNYIHTPSVVFRMRDDVFETLTSMGVIPASDYVLWMLNAQYGKIKKIKKVMAIYRYGCGIWSSMEYRKQLYKWTIGLTKLVAVIENKETRNKLSKALLSCNKTLNEIHENDINQINIILNSKTYKIGDFILKPFKWLKNILKKII